MASRKVQTALAMRDAIGGFADSIQRVRELDEIFMDSGYDAGGTNPITDEDVTAHDLTAADLGNVHQFRMQLDKFLNAEAPTVYDYWAAINALRSP